jgi:hypothetical protein
LRCFAGSATRVRRTFIVVRANSHDGVRRSVTGGKADRKDTRR